MDQGLNAKDCAIIGTITPDDMVKVGGECTFTPVAMGLVNANGFTNCPTVVSGVRKGRYLLFLWGDKPNPDLENPVYYNPDDPRQGLDISKAV